MRKILTLILLVIFTATVFTENIRTTPEAYWVSIESWESPFSAEKIIESSLRASGIPGEQKDNYIEKYKEMIENFGSDFRKTANGLTPYLQGEYILKWMHENVLSSYMETQTRMDNLIDSGNYNCVSSAILYLILARDSGLTAGIVETTDHAFSTVVTEKGIIDVETTTPFGFNPGVKQEFYEEFKKTGFTYVPPGNYRDRKQINDRDTIALIFQNRMSILQKKNLHDQVIGIAIDRWILSGSPVTKKDMNDAFRNWAAVLNNKGSYLEAFTLVESLSEKYKLLATNKDLLFSLAYNHMITLINSKKYGSAELFLNKIKPAVSEIDFIILDKMVTREKIEDLLVSGSYDDSLPIIRAAYISNNISYRDWKTWITIIHQNKAFDISKATGWWDAWQYLIDLPEDEKALQPIKRSTNAAHENWSIGIHNIFVELYNSKQYRKAEQLLLDNLEYDPANTILTKDLSLVRKQ